MRLRLPKLLPALLALLAALPERASAQGISPPNTLRFVPYADLRILDPVWTTAFITRNHGYLIYDTLFAVDSEGRVRPQMVENHTVSEDRLVWTFVLREGLRFHDGSPVTSTDVVASMGRWMRRDNAGIVLSRRAVGWEVIDPRTFRLTLREPYGFVLESLGKLNSNVPFIMREAEARTDAFQQITEVVGSGPFRFRPDQWVPGSRAVYERNPDYVPRSEPPNWATGGKVPRLERVEWRYIPDGNTAIAALNRGEVDWVEQPVTDLLPLVARNRQVTVDAVDPQGSIGQLRPNSLHPPFDKPEGRLALMYMVDQADYMRAVLGDDRYWRRCPSVFACGVPYENLAPDGMMTRRNYARARELLQQAGYDGRPIVVLNSTDVPWTAAFAQVTAQNLRAIGANVEVRAMDLSTMLTARARREPPENGGWHIFHSWGLVNSYQDPLGNNSIRMNGDQAFFGWPSDARMEELIATWLNAQTDEEKVERARAIAARAYEVAPFVPLGQFVAPTAYRSSLQGIVRSPVPFFWNVEKRS